MTFHSTNDTWNFTLHYIWLQPLRLPEVRWSRQLLTQLNMTLLTCTSWLWCPCQVVLLSDECVFECTLSSSPHSLVLRGLQRSWPSQDGSMHVFLLLAAWCASFIRSTTSQYFRMRSFFIPFVLVPCSINVPVPAITQDETISNPKIS